jgi:hypothetical protein
MRIYTQPTLEAERRIKGIVGDTKGDRGSCRSELGFRKGQNVGVSCTEVVFNREEIRRETANIAET